MKSFWVKKNLGRKFFGFNKTFGGKFFWVRNLFWPNSATWELFPSFAIGVCRLFKWNNSADKEISCFIIQPLPSLILSIFTELVWLIKNINLHSSLRNIKMKSNKVHRELFRIGGTQVPIGGGVVAKNIDGGRPPWGWFTLPTTNYLDYLYKNYENFP